MGRKDSKEYDWLEDPFNDAKNEQELLEAQKSKGRSCLIVVLVLLLVVVGIVVAACAAMTSVAGQFV